LNGESNRGHLSRALGRIRRGFARQPPPDSRAQSKAFAGCSGHALVAAGGAIFERVRTADSTEHHIEVHRGQLKRERTSNGYALYVQHLLDCTETGAAHSWWASLTPTRAVGWRVAFHGRGETFEEAPAAVTLADFRVQASANAACSMTACTKAWGRLPRCWRCCTSYSSENNPGVPQAARLRSNQRNASVRRPCCS
jgi:hypothetical protein